MAENGKPTLVDGKPTGGITDSGNNNHDGKTGEFKAKNQSNYIIKRGKDKREAETPSEKTEETVTAHVADKYLNDLVSAIEKDFGGEAKVTKVLFTGRFTKLDNLGIDMLCKFDTGDNKGIDFKYIKLGKVNKDTVIKIPLLSTEDNIVYKTLANIGSIPTEDSVENNNTLTERKKQYAIRRIKYQNKLNDVCNELLEFENNKEIANMGFIDIKAVEDNLYKFDHYACNIVKPGFLIDDGKKNDAYCYTFPVFEEVEKNFDAKTHSISTEEKITSDVTYLISKKQLIKNVFKGLSVDLTEAMKFAEKMKNDLIRLRHGRKQKQEIEYKVEEEEVDEKGSKKPVTISANFNGLPLIAKFSYRTKPYTTEEGEEKTIQIPYMNVNVQKTIGDFFEGSMYSNAPSEPSEHDKKVLKEMGLNEYGE